MGAIWVSRAPGGCVKLELDSSPMQDTCLLHQETRHVERAAHRHHVRF
jgi:hypothetical protein